MLIDYPADGGMVRLTDDPLLAAELGKTGPVIGITGPEPEYSLWSGVFYLAETAEAVDRPYAERVWSRFYKKPVTILQGEGWRLRETQEEDLDAIRRLYRDPQAACFLEHPTGGDDRQEAWKAWLEAYRRHVYTYDGPAMWSLDDGQGHLFGRLGLEWQNICGAQGYFLGYALLPEARRKGIVTRAAKSLLQHLEEWWEIDTVFLACAKENQASAAAAGRLGFELTKKGGQGVSVFCMSVSMPRMTDLV